MPNPMSINIIQPINTSDYSYPESSAGDRGDGDGFGSGGKRIACLNDLSTHGGSIIVRESDGTVHASGIDIAVHGAIHSCPIPGHGPTSIPAITTKSKINGKLILTKGAIAGCGAVIIPPDRKVYVE